VTENPFKMYQEKKMKKLFCSAVVLSTFVAGGCTTDPYTGEQKVSKAAIGAAAGAAVGAAASSKKDRAKGAVIGAAVVLATISTTRKKSCVKNFRAPG
jgi:outer membrane murein-binding lipoprotein Lpp